MVRNTTRRRGRGRPARHGTKTAVQHEMPYKRRKDATTKDLGLSDQTSKYAVDAVLDDNICDEATKEINSDLERELATNVFCAADAYFGLSPEEVRRLAYQFALKHEQPVSPAWRKHEMASEGWFTAFLKQNPSIPIRNRETPPHPPGECNLQRHSTEMLFSSLENLLTRCCFRPEAMWYMEEIGVAAEQSSHNRVATRRDYQQVSGNNPAKPSGLVTVTCSVSAAGTTIPPFFVFPTSDFEEDVPMGALVGTSWCVHPNGWIREDQFIDFLNHFVQHSNCSPERPCVLLTGSFGSYLSIKAIDFARENGVLWLTLPNHCLHLCSRMEWSICEPITTHICAAIEGWRLASAGKAVPLQYVPAIITRVLPLAALPRNIKTGFKSCGLFPLNPDIATDFFANHHQESPSETHPHSKPTSICNGGDNTYNAENHTYAAVAQDVQDQTGKIECSHTLSPGASAPTNGKATGRADIPESSEEDEGFCQVCMEPQSNSEVACQQCTVSRKCSSSNVPTSIAPTAQPQLAPQPTDITMDDGLAENTHELQNGANCDSSTIHTGLNLTHSAPEMSQDVTNTPNGNASVCSNGTSHLTNTSPNINFESHTNTALLPTANVDNHTHIDSVDTTNRHTAHTSDGLGAVQLFLDFPQSTIPLGSSSPKPAGGTPANLHSDSESSDDDEGLCQMCMERFPHANSEVLCLQCILRRKWGQSDIMDMSLNTSSATSAQGDFEMDHGSTEIDDQSLERPTATVMQEDSHNLQTHSLSDLAPTHNVGDDTHSFAQLVGELEDSHNQCPQQNNLSTSTDDASDINKKIPVSCHSIADHTPVDLVLPLTTQENSCEIPMEQHYSVSPEALQQHANVGKVCMQLLEHSSTEGANPSIHKGSHELQNNSNSELPPNQSEGHYSHSMSHPTGELENSPYHRYSTIDDSSDLPPDGTTVPRHNMADHPCQHTDSAFSVQDGSCETPMELHGSATDASEYSPSPTAGPSTQTTQPTSVNPPGSSTETTEMASDIALSCHSTTYHRDFDVPISTQGSSCETPMEEQCSAAEASECTPGPIVNLLTESTLQAQRHPPGPDSFTETTKKIAGDITISCHSSTDNTELPLSPHDHCETSMEQHCSAGEAPECASPTAETDRQASDHPPCTTSSTNKPEDPASHVVVSHHSITDHAHENFDSALGIQEDGYETPVERCSPVPGPSTEAIGQTPGYHVSSESSDDEDKVCQACLEPFENSNSEVMCLRCVLQKKWGQSGSFF